MNVLQKLSTLSDSLTPDVSNFDYINTACHFFMNQIPDELSGDFFIEKEIPGNGLSIGSKFNSVIRGNNVCRGISSSFKKLVSVTTSQYYVTVNDPVFYKEKGSIFVLPSPTNDDKAYVYVMPVDFIPAGSANSITSIPNVPENATHIILLYAGYLILFKKARDSRAAQLSYITDIGNAFTAFINRLPANVSIAPFTFTDILPTVPAITPSNETFSINFSAIGDVEVALPVGLMNDLDAITVGSLSIGNYLNDFPVFNFPGTLTDTSGTDFGNADAAIANAFKFVGVLSGTDPITPTAVPTGAFWLDDEDPEMSQSSVQLAAQEINRANAIIQKSMGRVADFSARIDAETKKFQGKVTEISMKLDADVKQMQAKIAELQARVQIAVEKINGNIAAKTLELQSNRTRLEKAGIEVQQESAKLQSMQLNFIQAIQNNQKILERYAQQIAEFSSKFQVAANIYTTNVQSVVSQAQINMQLAQGELQKIQTDTSKFQIESGNYGNLLNEVRFLYEKYMNELNLFLGMPNASK